MDHQVQFQLILALAKTGSRPEAMKRYRRFEDQFREELGEPPNRLQAPIEGIEAGGSL